MQNPNDRRAQVSGYEVVTEKEIFEYMARSGSTVTPAEAKASFEEITETVGYFLQHGYGINTGFLNIRPVITGVFHGDDDHFDHTRHKIRFRAHLGKLYNHVADGIRVEKVLAPALNPLPVELEDIASGAVNEILTPGGVATLTGLRLNFKPEDVKQGVFLKDASGTELRISRILSRRAKQVIFQIPADLAQNEYTLEVRILLSGNREVKTGTLPEKLTV
jgi:hypothetical protein